MIKTKNKRKKLSTRIRNLTPGPVHKQLPHIRMRKVVTYCAPSTYATLPRGASTAGRACERYKYLLTHDLARKAYKLLERTASCENGLQGTGRPSQLL